MSNKKDIQKSAKTTTVANKKAKGFTDEEQAAMKERIKEQKAGKANSEDAVLAKIAELPDADRHIAEQLHALIKANAPTLISKLWYGMPAYANKDGKIVCFFQAAQKFGTRYATLGFNDSAKLDDGAMWPVAFALKVWSAGTEATITLLIKKAVN